MSLPTEAEVLLEAERLLRRDGRVALCQLVRTEGSTPGKIGWKLVVPLEGAAFGNLGGGAFEALVKRDARTKLDDKLPESEVKRYYLTEEAVHGEPTGMVCGGMAEVFLEVLTSKPLLVICGGGPVGQALAANASLCGYDVWVVDDRDEFRRPELFGSEVHLPELESGFDSAFLADVGERDLFVAIVSRCWETDLAALESVLRHRPRTLRYLGLMGSTRKIDRVRQELEGGERALEGIDLHAPIGLPIGGDTPAEIAVSILAEMTQVRSASAAGS